MSESQKTQQQSHYYSDQTKLSFDQAQMLVFRYLMQDTPRDVTRVKHVLNEFDYPYTDHNMHRVLQALKEYCDPYNADKSGPTRFKIPKEYK